MRTSPKTSRGNNLDSVRTQKSLGTIEIWSIKVELVSLISSLHNVHVKGDWVVFLLLFQLISIF